MPQRPIALLIAAPASSFVPWPARAGAAGPGVGAHALAGLRRRAEQHDVACGQALEHLDRVERAQAQAHLARLDAAVAREPDAGACRFVAAQRVHRHHQRPFAAGGLHLHRKRHVLAQEGRRRLRQRELDLDRAALRIDQRRDGQHAGREALRREGVGQHGRLAELQLLQVALVDLRHQLQRAGQRQAEQRAAGLHDLAGLDHAREHARIGRCGDHGLAQAGLGGSAGRAGQRQLRLRLGDVGARLGVGRALRACAGQLRLRHGDRAARFVEPRLAEEALGHQVLRALQFGLRGRQHRLGLRHAGLRRAAPGAAQAGQARGGLAFAGLRLRQRGPQLVALQPHQHVACLDLRAFGHSTCSTRPVSVLPTSTRDAVATRAENCSVRTSGAIRALTAGTNGARVIHQAAKAARRTAARTAADMRWRRSITLILALQPVSALLDAPVR